MLKYESTRKRKTIERSIISTFVESEVNVCPGCKSHTKLERHHWRDGDTLYIALICHRCNRMLTNGKEHINHTLEVTGLYDEPLACPGCGLRRKLHIHTTQIGKTITVSYLCSKCIPIRPQKTA